MKDEQMRNSAHSLSSSSLDKASIFFLEPNLDPLLIFTLAEDLKNL